MKDEMSEALQRELEAQIKAFNDTINDGVKNGFDGKGEEIGSKAVGLGGAIIHLVGNELGRAFAEMQNREKRSSAVSSNGVPNGAERTSRWRQAFWGRQKSILEKCAEDRAETGGLQTVLGAVFSVCMLVGGLVLVLVSDFTTVSTTKEILETIGAFVFAGGWPFVWLFFLGRGNSALAQRLRRYAQAAGEETAISLQLLADASQQPKKKVREDLRELLQKGKLNAWINEKTDMLYLDQAAWRASREKAYAAQAKETVREAENTEKPLESETTVQGVGSLQTLQNFVDILSSEQKMMRDEPQAAEELRQLCETSRGILAWAKKHPENNDKVRRLTEQYIPITLKLLHTYNDLKMQGGDNAENVRRDIAGMLHTLNIGFANLQDQLLAQVAMDVSGDIAALQGMLARDGLSEDEISQLRKQ